MAEQGHTSCEGCHWYEGNYECRAGCSESCIDKDTGIRSCYGNGHDECDHNEMIENKGGEPGELAWKCAKCGYVYGSLQEMSRMVAKVTTPEDHRRRHVGLHEALDELAADFLRHTNGLPSKSTILELMEWSNEQTKNPTEEA